MILSTSRTSRLIALGVSLLLAGCAKPAPLSRKTTDTAVPVTVAAAESVPLDQTLSVVGTLHPKDEALVSAEVEGRVEKVFADMGDRVGAGQELVQIDTAAYEAQAQLARANLAKAQANSANAIHNLERIRDLRKSSISSPSELDVAVAQADQWAAEVRAQEATQAMADLNLKRSHVLGQFTAGVAERLINAGDFVRVGTPLYRLVNDAELKLQVQVNEAYASQVTTNQTIRFSVYAYPGESFEGRIHLISPAVNIDNRAFCVAAVVPNPERKLRANSFARGELVLARNQPTVVVPLGAVLNFAGVSKVLVVEKGQVTSREVETGRVHQKSGQQEIRRGIKAGELVALTGQTKLLDGSLVRIQTGKTNVASLAPARQANAELPRP